MRGLTWLALVVALAVRGSLLFAQEPPAAPPAMRGPEGRGGAPTAGQDRTDVMLRVLGLTKAEQAAIASNTAAKAKARQALQTELDKLRAVAIDERATDAALTAAVAAYSRALAQYRASVEKADKTLAAALSARSRARCLMRGILENGLGAGTSPAQNTSPFGFGPPGGPGFGPPGGMGPRG